MNQQNKTDMLEILIIMAMFFLILVIYIPVAIWEEESYYERESRYRMQNIYDVQSFYSRLTGKNTSLFYEALSVVNAVRDSTIADSLYLGEQSLIIKDQKYFIDVNQSYGFEYDTTFGIKSFRKDTLLDTIVKISMYSEGLGRDDTSFVQKKELNNYENSKDFIEII